MAWTCQVISDKDKSNVGMAIAVWNEGLVDEFRYSRRAQLTLAEADIFVQEAVDAKVARDAKVVKDTNLTTILQNKFNAL